MIKPSPPKKPPMAFFWKKTDSSTPASEARKADFCTAMGWLGSICTARMEPGKVEAKAIMPGPPRGV